MGKRLAAGPVILAGFTAATLLLAGAHLRTACAAAPSPAPTSVPAEAAVTIDALLGRLDAPDYHTRQKAQDALVSLGDEAVGPVERFARTTASVEARNGAAVVLERIKAERGLGPTFVTISLQKATIQQAAD